MPVQAKFRPYFRALRIVLQADFNLTYAQLGLLPALYMAGLMVACLVFNELTNHVNSFRLVGRLRSYALGVVQTAADLQVTK